MGCNTSQEQKSAVADSNGDIDTNNDTSKTARNSAKSDKSAKSAKSEKLTNGHDSKSNADKDEGKSMIVWILFYFCGCQLVLISACDSHVKYDSFRVHSVWIVLMYMIECLIDCSECAKTWSLTPFSWPNVSCIKNLDSIFSQLFEIKHLNGFYQKDIATLATISFTTFIIWP